MAKTERKAFSAYLYTDGTLIQPYEDHRNGVKVAETVDVTRGYCSVEIYARPDPFGKWAAKEKIRYGRIILTMWSNAGFVELARGGTVRAVLPCLDGGTQASQSLGLVVQCVTLVTRHGQELTWHEMPGILSAAFTLESRAVRVGPLVRGDDWGGMAVWQVKDLRKKGGRDGR